ncbi:hypothetical protein CASFOL_002918 [Castilleja foliolosa]|uniref:TF-B3 domain-containing protein n=1 Tax=Castilleja foliolosa TaxID=1961234 RepID=A0ABD3EFR7_9LAMI
MENESNGNSYEDARKQRLLENKKRFEDLGLSKLSKSLSDVKKSEKSQKQHIRRKPSVKYLIEPRRSSRARNPVTSYHDDVDLDQLPSLRKRKKLSSSWASYLARPIEEVKSATYEERARAHKCAEKLLSSLKAGNPSFVKSMVRSHVYSCFWLGLPSKFCEDHLPGSTVDMVLEDETGSEYDAVFISKRTGLSGGWRAFALDHKLDDGDALVFELIEPTKFKVYIVRAFNCEEENNDNVPVPDAGSDDEETLKIVKKRKKSDNKCQIKNSTKSDENGSSQVSGTRRSLRNKK